MKCKILMKALVLSAFIIANTTLVNASDNVLLAEIKEINMVEQASSLATMEIIDLEALEEPMIIGAGSGPMASYEWSNNKNKSFKISNNQQVEIQLMYIEAFTPNTDSKNIVLTFVGDNGEVVTQKFIDTDTTKTISFKEAGTYKLSIYNSQNFSINYGFKINYNAINSNEPIYRNVTDTRGTMSTYWDQTENYSYYRVWYINNSDEEVTVTVQGSTATFPHVVPANSQSSFIADNASFDRHFITVESKYGTPLNGWLGVGVSEVPFLTC